MGTLKWLSIITVGLFMSGCAAFQQTNSSGTVTPPLNWQQQAQTDFMLQDFAYAGATAVISQKTLTPAQQVAVTAAETTIESYMAAESTAISTGQQVTASQQQALADGVLINLANAFGIRLLPIPVIPASTQPTTNP